MAKCGAETEVYSRVCVVCGKPFIPKNQVQKTCSRECARAAFNIRRKEWRHKRSKNNRKVKICAFCGNRFERSYAQKYCSSQCAQAAWLKSERGKTYKRRKDARYNAKPEVKARKNQTSRLRWKINACNVHEKMRARKNALKMFPEACPCAICGDLEAERHHPDYSKPTKIVWLCKRHHEELHAKGESHVQVRFAM